MGLWSGNKRKMEIAESNSQPLVTMLRRGGFFKRRNPPAAPEHSDNDKTLDQKWRAWIEAESFKRVAFHVLIHDTQASISLLTRPLISYAEISLELPYTLALWRATSAHAVSNARESFFFYLFGCFKSLQNVSGVLRHLGTPFTPNSLQIRQY